MKKYIDLIVGVIIVTYSVVVNLLSFRKIAFSGIIGLIGAGLIIYHFAKSYIEKNSTMKKVMKISKIFICIGMVFFIILEAMIIAYPKKSKENTDYILVLGAGLNNGHELSQTLRDRLDTALKCINEYNNESYVVVSGGQGEDEDISEAEAMKRYLIENGINNERIIMENESRNTSQNFKFSRSKIEEHSGKDIEDVSVKIITTDFHGLRSSMLAKRNGYEEIEVNSSDTVGYLIPVFYTREAVAIVKSYIFDR